MGSYDSIKFIFNYKRIAFMSMFRKKERIHKKRLDEYIHCKRFLEMYMCNKEMEEIYEFISSIDYIPLIPYSFINEYDSRKICIYYDEKYGGYYTKYHSKNMYLKKSMDKVQAENYVRGILMEQDVRSPHHYSYAVDSDDIVADVGAAEGFFALDLVDKVKKIYLFECDSEWIQALHMTFLPYKEKVEIIPKYVSDTDDATHVTLNTFLMNRKLTLLKADIEGFEVAMLRGADRVADNIETMILCTYHNMSDGDNISALLNKMGFKFHYGNGYMFCPNLGQESHALRKLCRPMLYAKRI